MPEDEARRLLDRWQGGDRDDLAWLEFLRGPMTRAAARGIRHMTSNRAPVEDVEEAVFAAFNEFLRHDPARITEPVGLAATIAFRRGQDAGRRLNRIREFPDADLVGAQAQDPELALNPEDVVVEAAERERLYQFARECIELLPDGQAEVIRATMLADEELSNWANAKGKTYEAARKQRQKALRTLRDCVDFKRDPKEGR